MPDVMLDIGPLLLEGTRRNDEWQQHRRQVFPSDDIVLRMFRPDQPRTSIEQLKRPAHGMAGARGRSTGA